MVSAAASVASVGTLAAAAMPAHQATADDSELLKLEEQFFEQHEKASAYDDDIFRLGKIWQAESNRLYNEALAEEVRAGIYLSAEERWRIVTDIPECIEHNRLCNLQNIHYAKMEALVEQMWAIPAQTPEGRRAKVLVALRLLPDDWREVDEEADYGIRETRQLLIELVGGEPGAQLRDQFA